MSQSSTWTPEVRRSFKEVLYRFMGEVHATKAALYLKNAGNGWTLMTQYGFGRRDRLDQRLADDDAIVRMVRAFGNEPRYYNDPAEVGDVQHYLAQADTSRMMLVPLEGRFVGMIGFVDVRDKGGEHLFDAEDLRLASAIADDLTPLAEEFLGEEGPADQVVRTVPERELGHAEADENDDRPAALLDEDGVRELNQVAVQSLCDPLVVAVGLSMVSELSGAMVVHQSSASPALDRGPIIDHQLAALTAATAPAPTRNTWRAEIRRGPSRVATVANPVIASAVLGTSDGCAVAASVVADGDLAVARRALAQLRERYATARQRFRLRLVRRGLARRLLQPGDRRYPELVAHSLGVSRLCWSVARSLGLDAETAEDAALAGLLHDVGMRELDYDRLYMHPTPGPEDRRTYRMHVEVGARIVRVSGFDEIADAVRHHHERWDGNGYPDRLQGSAIPLLSRIVHGAEVFDLFTAANSYRPAVSRERALAILERAAGHQFDPEVVTAIGRVAP